jgi:uncharacterized repeat protein (TIGR01451 family)
MAFAAPAALAATTIGQVFTPTAQTAATVVQTGVGDGVGYSAPTDGVITSWSFQSDATGATVKLKAARRNPDGTYLIVGESDFQTTAPNQLQSFPARVPVKAGDVIGTAASTGKSVAYTGADADTVALAAGDQAPGSSGAYSDVHGIRMDLTANLEPDVDGDGFGDETQDKCPTDPSLQTTCSSDLAVTESSGKASHVPGDEVMFTVTVINRGPSLATGTQLLLDVSPELTFLSATPSAGSCASSKVPVRCSLGDIPNLTGVTVSVTALAKRVGVASAASKASSTAVDPNVANNGGGATVNVQWRAGSCANVFSAGIKNDVLRGTTAGDRLDGLAGNDVISGLLGADCITGGPGDDRLSGGGGNDRIDGGDGNDRITGGAGRDRITGGAGSDSVDVADSSRDTVDCGPGRDTVRIDWRDSARHCERITRVPK